MRYIPKYNEHNFSPSEVKAGMVTKFVDFLLKQDIEAEKVRQPGDLPYFTNINITSGGEMDVIVQWCQVIADQSIPCGQFEYVGEDEEVEKINFEDDLLALHIGDHTDHTEDGYDVPFKSLEKYRDCADCPQEDGIKITCDGCDDYKAKQRMEDYFDVVECTANDEQGENCDNECDICEYNKNNKKVLDKQEEKSYNGDRVLGWLGRMNNLSSTTKASDYTKEK